MPRAKYLSDTEKAQIEFLQRQGLSNREIAKEIERSATVVRNFVLLLDVNCNGLNIWIGTSSRSWLFGK